MGGAQGDHQAGSQQNTFSVVLRNSRRVTRFFLVQLFVTGHLSIQVGPDQHRVTWSFQWLVSTVLSSNQRPRGPEPWYLPRYPRQWKQSHLGHINNQ